MKILFFDPNIDAERETLKQLEAGGAALIVAQQEVDVVPLAKLHGRNLDLLILEEGASHALSELKKDEATKSLPLILLLTKMTSAEAAVHQVGPEGANAYLPKPYQFLELKSLIEQITGENLKSEFTAKLEAPDFSDPPVAIEISNQASDAPSFEIQAEPVPETVEFGETPQELDYLFKKSENKTGLTRTRSVYPETVNLIDPVKEYAFVPNGDALIPGSAGEAPDLETLKKYLFLREQDVHVLSQKLKVTREEMQVKETLLKTEQARSKELENDLKIAQEKLGVFDRDKQRSTDDYTKKIEDLNFELKMRNDTIKGLERKLADSKEDFERLKERVRLDLRKIRVREKELENRLELNKRDSDALLASREARIIELKRKLDLVEFNVDLLQEQLSHERVISEKLRASLKKAAQAMKIADGVLTDIQRDSGQQDPLKRAA